MFNSSTKSIAIAAAGTSGHIRPAWVLGHQAAKRGMRVNWVGSVRDTWVHGEIWDRIDINMKGVRNQGIMRLLTLPWVLSKAIFEIYVFFSKTKPDAVILMGGYVTVPSAIAACLLRIPYVVFEQNTVLCLSNRIALPLAKKAYTGLPLAVDNPKVSYVGNPLPDAWVRPESHRSGGKIKLLVMGGSQGAHALNSTLPVILKDFSKDIVIKHIAGPKHVQKLQETYEALDMSSDCYGYVDGLKDMLLWADMVVTRSGAMSMTECLSLCLPCIMVPFPKAADDHQLYNALWFASLGGGVCVKEGEGFESRMRVALKDMLAHGEIDVKSANLRLKQKTFDQDIFWGVE